MPYEKFSEHLNLIVSMIVLPLITIYPFFGFRLPLTTLPSIIMQYSKRFLCRTFGIGLNILKFIVHTKPSTGRFERKDRSVIAFLISIVDAFNGHFTLGYVCAAKSLQYWFFILRILQMSGRINVLGFSHSFILKSHPFALICAWEWNQLLKLVLNFR